MTAGVIFDLDGTLGDTLPVCFEAFRTVLSEFVGITYDDDAIREMFGPTEEGILAARIPGGNGRPVERYLEVYRDAHHLAPTPFPGMVETIDWLSRREIPMAIVTGKGRRSAELSLRYWGLQDRFDPLAAGSEHGNVKDRNMRRVVAEWGAPAEHVVSVGDAETDIEAARTAGVVAVAAAWASTADRTRLEAAGPDHLFTDVDHFDAWLRSGGGTTPS